MWNRVEEQYSCFHGVFCLCEGLLSVSAVFQVCWIGGGKQRDVASESSTNHGAVAGVNSMGIVCSACARTVCDLVPCVGTFKVRRAGDGVVEPFNKPGVQRCGNVTKLWSPRLTTKVD